MNNNADEAKKNLEKVQKNAPKIGTSISEYKAAKAEHDALVAEAQKAVDYWNGVKAEHAKRALEAEEAEKNQSKALTDNQGNPINEDGTLNVEEVKSVDELTDEDFSAPTRNVQLPTLPQNVDAAIGADGKPVVIKKNIFEKNKNHHKDLTSEQSKQILEEALYSPNLYGRNQSTTRPYNWILIHNAKKHSSVIVEVNHNKDNVEIVNWHYLDDTALEQKKRQAVKEGGLILTLESAAGNTQNDLSSDSKVTEHSKTSQGNEKKTTKGDSSKTIRGRKQVVHWLKKFDESNNILDKITCIHNALRNVKLGDEGAITAEEQAKVDQFLEEIKEQGYEITDYTGKEYDEGVRCNVDDFIPLVGDEEGARYNVEDGQRRVVSVSKPEIIKDGEIVQKAKIKVAQREDTPFSRDLYEYKKELEALQRSKVSKTEVGKKRIEFIRSEIEELEAKKKAFLEERAKNESQKENKKENQDNAEASTEEKGQSSEAKANDDAASVPAEKSSTASEEGEKGGVTEGEKSSGTDDAVPSGKETNEGSEETDDAVPSGAEIAEGDNKSEIDALLEKLDDPNISPLQRREGLSQLWEQSAMPLVQKLLHAVKNKNADAIKGIQEEVSELVKILPAESLYIAAKESQIDDLREKGEDDKAETAQIFVDIAKKEVERREKLLSQESNEDSGHDWSQYKKGDTFVLDSCDTIEEASLSGAKVQFKRLLIDRHGNVVGVVVHETVKGRRGKRYDHDWTIYANEFIRHSELVKPKKGGSKSKTSSKEKSLRETAEQDQTQAAEEAQGVSDEQQTESGRLPGKSSGRRKYAEGSGNDAKSVRMRKAAEYIAKKLGVKIAWDDTYHANGEYDPNTNTIHIAKDAENPLAAVFGHESLHRVRAISESVYKSLLDAVKDFMGEDAFNEAAKAKYKFYNEHEIPTSMDDAGEEVVGDAIGRMVHDKDYAEKLAYKLDHPVLSAIKDFLTQMKDVIVKAFGGGSEEARKVNGLLRTIDKAYKRAVKEAKRTAKVDDLVNKGGTEFENNSDSDKFLENTGKKYSLREDKNEEVLRDVVIDHLKDKNGVPVSIDHETGQRVLDMAKGRDAKMSAKQKRALDTVTMADESTNKATAISSADGAKIQSNLETLADSYKNRPNKTKGFITDLSQALNLEQHEASHYGTFETQDGKSVTIRVSNHNARVSLFDENGEDDGISIVISNHKNKGLLNDGNAHIVEYFYPKQSLQRADSKPLSDIIRSVSEALNSGKFEDRTGLAQRQEVNGETIREHRVYHGSGADFEEFDHSHMGEGQGAQVYGWGTYVTEVEGIGRTYAEQNPRYLKQEKMKEKIREIEKRTLAKFGNIDCGFKVVIDDDYTPSVVGIPRNKITLEQFKDYFKKNAFDFASYDGHDVDDYDLNKEKDRELFARDVELSMAIYVDDIKRDYIYDKRNLYTVEIPDDNGSNYLDWSEPIGNEQIESIRKYLSDNYRKQKLEDFDASIAETKSAPNADEVNDWVRRGENVYKTLVHLLGSDKEASKALSEMGFVGIKYPADYRRGGREDGAKNYVIFNEKDAKITDHVRFFKTKDGEAYGFTVGGRIYIDPRIANAETPIHEYGHLWASALKSNNPKEWQNVVGLMKNTGVWDEVKKTYPELKTDDEIADEVLTTYSGRRGAERLREEARKIASGDGNVMDKAKAVSALQKVKEAIDKFWHAVADFLHIHYTSAEQVADQVMKDLIDGVDPRKAGEKQQAETQGRKRYSLREENKETSHKTLKGDEALAALDEIFKVRTNENLPKPISTLKHFTEVFKHPIRTFLGELVKVKDEVFNKIIREKRTNISGALLSTIENADFAIRDIDGSTLYVKRYKSDNSGNTYNVVAVNKHGEVEDYVSSVHIKRDGNLRNKVKNGAELLLPQERNTDGNLSRNNSTPTANVAENSESSNISDENSGKKFSLREGEENSTSASGATAGDDKVKSIVEDTMNRLSRLNEDKNEARTEAKAEAVEAVGGSLREINKAMRAQRVYDFHTVESIVHLAKDMLKHGLLKDLSNYEASRLFSVTANVHGKKDIKQYVQKVMDIMVNNQLHNLTNDLSKLLMLKGKKVNASGVEVQGGLDLDGQHLAEMVWNGLGMTSEDIQTQLADAQNRMGDENKVIAHNAELEYQAYQILQNYHDGVVRSKSEEQMPCISSTAMYSGRKL